MNTRLTRTLAAAFALPAALGLAACSAAAPQEPTEDTAATAQTAESQGPAGEEDSAEDEDSAGGGAGEETGGTAGSEATVEVEAEGEGPIGLRTSSTPEDSAEAISGKFIVGQGSCFALTAAGDKPSLLVFSQDASFTLREGKPSVTTDDLGTVDVGTRLEASAVSVDPADVTGLPERCTHGVDEVLVVTGR